MDIEKYVMEYSNIVPKDLSDEVMESKNSIVFDQAENRMHVQQALLACLLS